MIYALILPSPSMEKPIRNSRLNLDRRREMRRKLTPAEAKLWSLLKGRSLAGRKFRRQYGVGPFYLDFFCPEENLAVELDGEVHAGPIASARDADRTQYLQENGIRVIRFENRVVFSSPEWVLGEIENAFQKK